jgi:hypothetical protein
MIVEAQHAVNAATACSRLAKATQSSAKSAESDDLRVQAFFKTVSRMGTSMDAAACGVHSGVHGAKLRQGRT